MFDSAGNLYGTASFSEGVNSGQRGTVFELSPTSSGKWKAKILRQFYSSGPKEKEGWRPAAELIIDAPGNLYGTTWRGRDE